MTLTISTSTGKERLCKMVGNVFKDSNLAGMLQQSKSKAEMIEIIEKIPLASDHNNKVDAYMATDQKYLAQTAH